MQLKIFIISLICFFEVSTAFAAFPSLNFGAVSINATSATFTVSLANVSGTAISGLSTDIGYNPAVFKLQTNTSGNVISATTGNAATSAGKNILQSNPAPGVLRIGVIDLAGNSVIADGAVAQVSFTIIDSANLSNQIFTNSPQATNASGSPVAISGMATSTGTIITGDISNNGKVELGDALLILQAAVGSIKLTASQSVYADMNKDGRVDVGDAILILAKVVGL